MRARAALVAILVVVAVMAGGGWYLEHEAGARAPAQGTAEATPSAAWLCPHGGGSDWTAALSLANPGPTAVQARVTSYGAKGPTEPEDVTVPPRARVSVDVPAGERGASAMVEYFGGWVAASWVATAGGTESGVAAAPCAPAPGRTWFLPDGTTVKGEDAYVVVMNPFAAEAVFTLTLVTETRTVRPRAWSLFGLPPGRSVAFHLNGQVLGERTVATEVSVSTGRVAAGCVGVKAQGGVRATVGVPAGMSTPVLPGAAEAGESEVPVLNLGSAASYAVVEFGPNGLTPVEDLRRQELARAAVRTDVAAASGAAFELRAQGSASLVAARRAFGTRGDVAATEAAAPARAWVVPTVAASGADDVRVFLTNPGTAPVEVRLEVLSEGGGSGPGTTVTVPPGVTTEVPSEFNPDRRQASLLAVAADGTFVPLAASYGADGGFAEAVGIPIPDRWVPTS